MIRNDKRETALAALTAYANGIRTEIERKTLELNTELSRVEQAIAALSGEGAPLVGAPIQEHTSGGEYEGLGPQGAVEKFLRANPGQLFRPNAIASAMKASGFTVSNPKLASQQVMIALMRAAKKGVATEGSVEGKRAFQLNPNPDKDPTG
jgi:hypothetical protein